MAHKNKIFKNLDDSSIRAWPAWPFMRGNTVILYSRGSQMWVATQKWVAGPEFLTLDSMRAPKSRH
jgi:hypothetical protein